MKSIQFKPILLILFFIFCLLSCHKTTFPDSPNECKILASQQIAYDFMQDIDLKGSTSIDSSIYLKDIVGEWKMVHYKAIQIKQHCYMYLSTDSINTVSFNFKPDFTFTCQFKDSTLTGGLKTIQDTLIKTNQSFSYSVQSSSPYEFYFDSIYGNKMRLGFHYTLYSMSYFRKV